MIESSGSDAPVATLIDSVHTIEGAAHEDEETDPHWWENPRTRSSRSRRSAIG